MAHPHASRFPGPRADGITTPVRVLFHLPLSPYARKVRLALAEKRIPFELRVERVWERRPEFLEMNPAGTVQAGFIARNSSRRSHTLSTRRSKGMRFSASARRTLRAKGERGR